MAIFGIGALYDSEDMLPDFLSSGVVCVGWGETANPAAHAILRQLRTGDIVFIKSFNPNVGLTIKAVGIVTDGREREVSKKLGTGVCVRWVWRGKERFGKVKDNWPMRSVTIYEEHHPDVHALVIKLLLPE